MKIVFYIFVAYTLLWSIVTYISKHIKHVEKNDDIANNQIRFNELLPNGQTVVINYNEGRVIYNNRVLGRFEIKEDGRTLVSTSSGIRILSYRQDDVVSFINVSKNENLAKSERLSASQLVSPFLIQVNNLFLSTMDDHVIAKYVGDKNGAVASFVCAYTELFAQNEYYDYFFA